MRVLLIALFAAISYAQTVGFIQCEKRHPMQCSGPGEVMRRICMLDRREMPPQCVEGDPMDPEDVCASKMAGKECTSDVRCCLHFRDRTCVKKDLEDCPALFPGLVPGMTGGAVPTGLVPGMTGGAVPTGLVPGMTSGTTAITSGSGFGVTTGTSTSFTTNTGASIPTTNTNTAGNENSIIAPTGTGAGMGAGAAMGLPLLTPNPPMMQRQMTLDCAALTLQGEATCNRMRVREGRLCTWDVREMQCTEVQPGWGNLCQSIHTGTECNGYRDCCWDAEQYCDELDTGDCPGRLPVGGAPVTGGFPSPIMPQPGAGVMPGMPSAGMGGMEEAMEAQQEAAEARAEMAENQAEMAEKAAAFNAAGFTGFPNRPVMPIIPGNGDSGASGNGLVEGAAETAQKDPGSINVFFGPNAEEHAEAHAEAAEAHAEAHAEAAEAHAEAHEEMMENRGAFGINSFPQVSTCTGLHVCFGRVGLDPCVTDPRDGQCKEANMRLRHPKKAIMVKADVKEVKSCSNLKTCFGRVETNLCITDPKDGVCKELSLDEQLSRSHHSETSEPVNFNFNFALVTIPSVLFGVFVGYYCSKKKSQRDDILLDEYQAAI